MNRGRQRTSTACAAALALLALALGACGGGDDGAGTGERKAPETAQLAPASAAFFVSIDTDFEGEQWQMAEALLDKFPDGDELLNEIESSLGDEDIDFERDVKPAVGPEVGIVGFDLASDDPPVVGFTKPPNAAKLKALLEKGDDPVVLREIEGWTVVAETEAELDRFERERGGQALADSAEFKDALDTVDADAGVVAYFGGAAVQQVFDEGLSEEGAPPGLSRKLGTLRSFVASASAEEDGVRFEEVASLGDDLGLETYAPALDEAVPAKPLLFISVGNLDTLARKALDAVEGVIPDVAEQRAQFEKALGFSIENDVLPLLAGEVAVAIYGEASGAAIPVTADILFSVDDEAKARRVMERVTALVELGESGKGTKLRIGSLDANELHFTDEDFSIFWAAFEGKLAISTSRDGLAALDADSARLADDDAYTSALDLAEAPDEVAALVYSDLQTAVPFFLRFAGDDIDAKTRANLEPLHSFVGTLTDDGGLRISSFLGID